MAEPIVQAVSEQVQITLTDTCDPGDAVGLDSAGNWIRADADAAAPIRAECFALHRVATSGDRLAVAKRIILFDDDGPYTKGGLVFLSGVVGGHTQTNPGANTPTKLLQVLGKAYDTKQVFLDSEILHLTIPFSLPGTDAATAANYGVIFVSDRNWRLIGLREAHTGAGSDASAVALDLEKLIDAQALDAGVVMTAGGGVNLKGSINSAQGAAPTGTIANARLKPGDRIALKDSGVLTVVAGVAGSI